MSGPAAPPAPPLAKAWGAPFDRLDRRWTGLEQFIAVGAILLEIATLTAWVALKGLATSSSIGVLFRALVGAVVLGLVAYLIVRPKRGQAPQVWQHIVVTVAVIIGVALAPTWSGAGNDGASNWAEWLQSSSALALIGGPRGMVTRLTLWLALLGGSMAASKGKHINIDVATRYIPMAYVKPVAILGWVAAAMVCFAASFGFVDSIAVTKFRAEAFRSCGDSICDTAFSERMAKTATGMRSDFFLLRRQISLDFMSLPHLLSGDRYDQWLTPEVWNAWVKEGDWAEYYPPDSVAAMPAPTDDPTARKMPAVVAPDTGEGRDLLIRDLNFILPFGLLMIGLKFLLRTVRALSGHVKIDPGSAHEDEDLTAGHDALHEGHA